MESIISKLHPLERSVLPVLLKEKEISAIAKLSNLQEIEVMRALQWLENKNVLKINVDKKKIVDLEENGIKYKKEGLPEKRLLQSLTEEFQSLGEIAKKTRLSTEELNACIGILRRKVAIEIDKGKDLMLKLGPQGKKLLKDGSFEEKFLTKDFPLDFDLIQDIDKFAFDELKKRKGLLKIEEKKTTTVTLTELGKKLASTKIDGEVINRLTMGMLKTGSWKGKNFRAYDVEINVPKVYRGKKHFVNEAVEYIKRIWLELGFKEMSGNYVQSAFWDLDALFVPQDHPAREMQDTFYLEGKAKLPKFWEKVKAVHENGANTGSKGWQYTFSKEETEKVLLRTHTTVLSAQTISNLKKEDLPAKFFSVNKVFRNESLDWKHLFEFYQVEGIVIDPNANMKHLKGYLREFYKKMGYPNVRMRPAHFPYTEPSVEVDVYHPIKKQWVELGGAGIFRPEVVKPLLGFECPVLAWGQGMARIIAEYWKITDIRDLYKNDLKQIKEMKAWIK
ncbi:phenylalanine--tRNA ligase subunit alpha [Candidatus Woesearchaeota archaeon CG_4_10_14_0_2_um_filter_33_13]|nr:MAG: phenylalanine--tRNA ligase subunit alpha [Candidatus Woesearchaeota archaeon CG_4_10_14_0_2_um_filter_33_13]